MINKEEFEKFLGFTAGAKDVSLVVGDEKQLEEMVKELAKAGFDDVVDVWGLMKLEEKDGKGYLVLNDGIEKEVYDFVAQYPTGQVQIWDSEKNDVVILDPVYEKVSVLLLTTEENLKKIETEGYLLMDKVGLVYRERGIK